MEATKQTTQYSATLFQRKFNRLEIENEITKTERAFSKACRSKMTIDMLEIEQQLGILYKRLMTMNRIICYGKNKVLKIK